MLVDPAIKPSWEEFAVYLYSDDGINNGAWPGAVLTESDEGGRLVYELPAELQGKDGIHVIINNNATAENGRANEQIEDGVLVIGAGQQRVIAPGASWIWEDHTPSNAKGTTTIYIDPAVKPEWKDFAVYIWGDGVTDTWPGAVLTKHNISGYLTYTLPREMQAKDGLHVIINNNADANGVENEQLEDEALIISADQHMLLAPGTAESGWSWTQYTPAAGENHWAAESIGRWVAEGLIQGSGGDLDPNQPLTRGQVATVIARLLKLEEKADISEYADVPADAWYADGIAKCIAAGIVLGEGNAESGGSAVGGGGFFMRVMRFFAPVKAAETAKAEKRMDPDGIMNRTDMFAMTATILGIPESDSPVKTFPDSDKIAPYARGYINALVNLGIIKGTPDGSFAPDAPVTYASATTVFDTLIGTYADEPGTYPVSDKGLTLVVADDVKLTGEASDWSVVVKKDDAAVDLSGVTGEVTVTVESENVTLTGTPRDATITGSKAEDTSVQHQTPSVPSIPSGPSTPSYQNTTTVYIDPRVANNWQGVWVYGYADDGTNNGDWPGAAMAAKNDKGYYVYKLPETLQGKTVHLIIHNNVGEGVDGDVRHNVDINADGQRVLTKDSEWTNYNDSTAEQVPEGSGPSTPTYENNTTVYIDPRATEDWGGDGVYVYGYADDGTNNGDWPGAKMVTKNDKGYYVYELPETLQGKTVHLIIHNNVGEGVDGDVRHNVDINADGQKVLTKDSKWTNYNDSTAEQVPEGSGPSTPTYENNTTVYIDPRATENWGGDGVYVYAYDGNGTDNGWPGAKMETKNDKGYYVYKLPETLQGKTVHLIIHNNVGENQDGDIRILQDINPDEQKLVTQDSQWTDYDDNAETIPGTEPSEVVTTTLYVSDAFRTAQSEWNGIGLHVYIPGGAEGGGDLPLTSWPGTINAKEESGDWAGYWKYVIGTDANLHAGDTIAVIANDGVDQSGKQTESKNITAGSTWLLTADSEWKDVGGSYKPPRVTVTPEAKEFTVTLTVTVTATDCTEVSYTVNSGDSQTLSATGGEITVGEDGEAGEYTVTVTGKSAHETVEVTVTYTKTAAEPGPEPQAQTVLTVYVSDKFVRAKGWKSVAAHFYDPNNAGTITTTWPGVEGTSADGTWAGYWKCELTDDNSEWEGVPNITVIVNNNEKVNGKQLPDYVVTKSSTSIISIDAYGFWHEGTSPTADDADFETTAVLYIDPKIADWAQTAVSVHFWDGPHNTQWPGMAVTTNKNAEGYYVFKFPNELTAEQAESGKSGPLTYPIWFSVTDGERDSTQKIEGKDAGLGGDASFSVETAGKKVLLKNEDGSLTFKEYSGS